MIRTGHKEGELCCYVIVSDDYLNPGIVLSSTEITSDGERNYVPFYDLEENPGNYVIPVNMEQDLIKHLHKQRDCLKCTAAKLLYALAFYS